MKVSDQSYIPLLVPTVQSKKPGVTTPAVSGNHVAAPDRAHVEQSLNNEGGRSSRYPAASDQENQARYKRAGVRFKPRKPPKAPMPLPPSMEKPAKSPVPSKPAEPAKPPAAPKPAEPAKPSVAPKSPKPTGGSKGVQGAVNNSQSIGNLHNANAFTPLSSQLASSVRNSLLSASVGTLIQLPFSVAEHVGSKAITDRIYAQAEMPGAEKKNADGTVTTVDPSATQQQKLDARLEGAEIKTELMVNNILSINEGKNAKAVGKDPSAPTDTPSRLTALEKRMDAIEEQMESIGERYGIVYKPYVALDSSQAPTDESRMKDIEGRYAYMNKMTKVLIASRNAIVEDEE